MKTTERTTGKTVVDFDQMGFDAALADLEGFAKTLNKRPCEDNDPLSLRQLTRNGIVNESFVTGAVKIGLTPSLELLKKVLQTRESLLRGIVVDAVLAELNKQGLHEAVKRSVLQSYEPDELAFISVINRLNSSYSQMGRPRPGRSTLTNQIENYLTFVDGLATVTDETKEEIRELFTIRLDTPGREEIYNLLNAAGEAITKLNAKLLTQGKYFTPMTFDSEYLTNEGNTIIGRNDIMKFF